MSSKNSVWLVQYTNHHNEKIAIAFSHNPIDKFLVIDPYATSVEIGIGALIEIAASSNVVMPLSPAVPSSLPIDQPPGIDLPGWVFERPSGTDVIVVSAPNAKTWIAEPGDRLHMLASAVIDASPKGGSDALKVPDTDGVREILGRMCFQCIRIAQVLRLRGDEIKERAEDEQAAVLRFLLNHYLASPDQWAERAQAEINAIREQAQATSAEVSK